MRLADRRAAARFEIVGELWGSVQTLEPLLVHNLTPQGALVESIAPLPVGSIQPLRLVHGTRATDVRAIVRHLSPLHLPEGGRRYRAGLEFINVDERAAESIGALMDDCRRPPLADEA